MPYIVSSYNAYLFKITSYLAPGLAVLVPVRFNKLKILYVIHAGNQYVTLPASPKTRLPQFLLSCPDSSY